MENDYVFEVENGKKLKLIVFFQSYVNSFKRQTVLATQGLNTAKSEVTSDLLKGGLCMQHRF